MNRTDFEILRDFEGKRISQDIRFVRCAALYPVAEVGKLPIGNQSGTDLRMNLRFNPETESKTVNVFVPGTGPTCRLDVDGPRHGAAGRSHKHALRTERCPDRNLPDEVVPCPDLSGRSMREVFEQFCHLARIEFHGTFFSPEEA
ncbi:MAG: hypothetical protein HYV63_19855 [Candidatus Schekmanbacteria bacterium]|nr:hypothetical protein [Candidatus Schekmanbacteria bacterium]